MTHNRQNGFTLIELLIAIGTAAILMAAAMNVYSSYRNKAMLTAAESNIITALNDFGVKYDYSPETGKLADLVTGGAIKAIPNDPWTDKQTGGTGTEEAGDWHYDNDGDWLTVYPLSHPDKVLKAVSFGLSQGAVASAKKATPGKKAVDLKAVQGADILGLTPAQVASLTPEQIAMMSAADFAKLSAAQKAALTQTQLDERAIADKVRAMVQEQFPSLPADQIKYITTDQVASIKNPWWFGQLVKSAGGGALTQAQIQAASPSVMGPSVGALTVKQIGWLSPDQVGAVQGGDPLVSMLKKKPDLISKISPDQVASIKNPWWFGQLVNSAAGGALTQAQVQAVSPSVMGPSAGALTVKQIGWLTPDQVGAVQGGGPLVSMLKKKPDLISKISPDQIASVKNPWWFGQLVKSAGAGLTAAQVQAIPADMYAKIKDQLTADQRAWRP